MGIEARQSAEELLPIVYTELKRIATAKLSHEHGPLTLQATALIHEAYLRLTQDGAVQNGVQWDNQSHFIGAAAEAMRRILVERARKRIRRQRLVGTQADIDPQALGDPDVDDQSHILAVHEALDRLVAMDQRLAELVKLRFFAGLSLREAAAALGLSESTAKRNWRFAQTWLRRELKGVNGLSAPSR